VSTGAGRRARARTLERRIPHPRPGGHSSRRRARSHPRTAPHPLPFANTAPPPRRKEQYEAQLAQIEKDIEKLSKPVIWIHKDD